MKIEKSKERTKAIKACKEIKNFLIKDGKYKTANLFVMKTNFLFDKKLKNYIQSNSRLNKYN